ncbi:MAG TPA: hypothetical protein VFD13_06645 [Candidatus Kapabacteria bacterium]|nr:hypothetical protein [Candidatus Kapabacteria bacterium]
MAILLLMAGVAGCDRGAGEEIGVARKFTDAVVSNNAPLRDSMIATQKFKDYFQNAYVANDMLTWFRSFYNYRTHQFDDFPSADVDYDLSTKLRGVLIDTNQIEETGMVIVKSPTPGVEPAYFWLVHQEGQPWRVAVVTKGESEVNFQ